MKIAFILLVFGAFYATAVPKLTRQFPQRIVGGSQARKGEFPWIVQIKKFGGHYCGGSIVNGNWIVTAAHCSLESISGYNVVAGEHNLNSDEGTEQSRSVVQIKIHSEYNAKTLASDIAVWKLNSPLELNDHVKIAKIAPPGFKPSSRLVAAGWGALKENGDIPTTLMKVTVPLVSNTNCREVYGDYIRPGMICAGTGGRDSCQGDSGGPLHSGSTLAGIVSWGIGCARPNYPGVYADVAYYNSWIINNTES